MQIRFAVVAFLLPLVASAANPKSSARADHFQRSGLWKTQVVLERDGKKLEPIVSKKCIVPEKVEAEENSLFQPFPTGCKADRHVDGKTITWSYECAGPPPMKGSGKLTWTKDQYSGTSESFADLKGGNSLQMTRTSIGFSAHRIGDCPAAPAKPGQPSKPGKAFKKPVSASPDVATASGSTAIR